MSLDFVVLHAFRPSSDFGIRFYACFCVFMLFFVWLSVPVQL